MFRRQPRNRRSCLPVDLEFAEVRLHVRLEVARACFPVNLEGAQVFFSVSAAAANACCPVNLEAARARTTGS